jgi:hypothetical protein
MYLQEKLSPPPTSLLFGKIGVCARDAFVISSDLLVKGLPSNYDPDRYIPGFPSFRNLPFMVVFISKLCVIEIINRIFSFVKN